MVLSASAVAAATSESPAPQAPQSGVCQGVVTDASGETVIGAGLRIKGSQTGAVTDLDGNFTL